METPVRDLSDAQLAVAIGRFRDDALAEAYRRHGGAVFALARRVTGDSGDAEDVTQEVFLRLWNQPDRFDADRGSMRSFLLAQSHGKAVDLVRSRTARARREERDARATASAGYDLEHEVWDLAVADQWPRPWLRSPTRSDRPSNWPISAATRTERCRPARTARGHREEPDTQRSAPDEGLPQ